MQAVLGTLTGKAVATGLKFRRGGGQALPGRVIEKLFPGYVAKMLAKLPEGVVIITGTNGKTTTTKMVVEILKANGKQVLTNSTGSNLVRGIASSVSQHAKITGKLPYDIAVLEVDEATARLLAQQIPPRWVLALNVSRDQLDRYGEVDTIASYVGSTMAHATKGVVVNAADPHLLAAARRSAKNSRLKINYFGSSASLAKYFPTDYELAAVTKPANKAARALKPLVELAGFSGQRVDYKIAGKNYRTNLKISGQHNFLNGAAALALCMQLLPEASPKPLVSQLATVSLAFGRGERYRLKNGAEVEIVLVKNPASFTQALASYGSAKQNLMIAINDRFADGRDVSWLWDVNLKPLEVKTVFVTSGSRAADMALRLSYDDLKTVNVQPNLSKALDQLAGQTGPKIVLATYTAMLQLYKQLNKQAEKI